MDVTTLIAGPAQAGSKPPVGKPGAGCTAGAGSAAAAGAAPDHGFASLVEAALDPQGGVLDVAPRRDLVRARRGRRQPMPAETMSRRSIAAADAATLSLLIALTTPSPRRRRSRQPDVAAPGTSNRRRRRRRCRRRGDGGRFLHEHAPAGNVAGSEPATAGLRGRAGVGSRSPTQPAAISCGAGTRALAPAPVAGTPVPAERRPRRQTRSAAGPQPANAAGAVHGIGSRCGAADPRQTRARRPAAGGAPAAPGARRDCRDGPADTRSSTPATQPGRRPPRRRRPRRSRPTPRPPLSARAAPRQPCRGGAARRRRPRRARVRRSAAHRTRARRGDGLSDGAPGGFAGGASWAPFGRRIARRRAAASLASPGSAEIVEGAAAALARSVRADSRPGWGRRLHAAARRRRARRRRFEQTLSSVDPDVRNLAGDGADRPAVHGRQRRPRGPPHARTGAPRSRRP